MQDLNMDPVLYHIYDSKNPLHEEYNSNVLRIIKSVKLETGLQVVSIDLDELESEECDKLVREITGKTITSLKGKAKPRFFLKNNAYVKAMPNTVLKSETDLKRYVRGNLMFEKMKSVADVAQALELYNTGLGDCTVLFYLPTESVENEFNTI